MKGMPESPKTDMGPFPLESNLRQLKPSLARLGPIISGLGILFIQEDWWRAVAKYIGTTSGIVIVALLTAVLLFYILDLFLKQVWFNERGIGIAKVWGGSKTWYSFDELKGGQFKMRRRTHGPLQKRRLYKPSSRMTLNFHTGSVRIWPSLYDSKSVNDLLGILSRRFPDTYTPPEPSKEMKKELEKQLKAKKSSGRKQSTPQFPSLFGKKKKNTDAASAS